MKVILEFGIRGGWHTDNVVLPSAKLAAKLARDIACVLMEGECTTNFTVRRNVPRISLQNSSHFIAVTLLDGKDRGPASSELWTTGVRS